MMQSSFDTHRRLTPAPFQTCRLPSAILTGSLI